jgi:DNA-binding transcriptional ArsR family regulator
LVRLLTNMPRPLVFPIEVVATPRFDVFYALHALTTEAPTPLQSWRDRAKQRLTRDFERVAKRVAPVPIFWPLLADALQDTAGAMGFDDMLSTLSSMPAGELSANVIAGIFRDRPTVSALLTRKRTLRGVLTDDRSPGGLLSHFGLLPYTPRSPAAVAIDTLLSDPESYRDDLIMALQKFWQSGFSADWSALEPGLRGDAARLKSLCDRNSIARVADELRLPVSFDEDAGVMRTKSGTVVKLEGIERCYLVPSAFNTRRWWAKYESKGDRVTLYFPVWGGAESANRLAGDVAASESARRRAGTSRAPSVDAEAVFRALGDTTRYAIASILARNPTSSADLSRSLKVSKPTITHHVQSLRSAGLITEKPEGGSSRLSLNRETIAALSASAVQDLFSSTRELQLLTTRKRRR